MEIIVVVYVWGGECSSRNGVDTEQWWWWWLRLCRGADKGVVVRVDRSENGC